MSRILFIANAGPAVGGGHVMRSLTLAAALTERGAECLFLADPAVEAILAAFAPDIGRRPVADLSADSVREGVRCGVPLLDFLGGFFGKGCHRNLEGVVDRDESIFLLFRLLSSPSLTPSASSAPCSFWGMSSSSSSLPQSTSSSCPISSAACCCTVVLCGGPFGADFVGAT